MLGGGSHFCSFLLVNIDDPAVPTNGLLLSSKREPTYEYFQPTFQSEHGEEVLSVGDNTIR